MANIKRVKSSYSGSRVGNQISSGYQINAERDASDC